MAKTSYELDDAAVDLIAQMFQQIKAAEAGIGAVLAYFAKQNGLVGVVRLGADRRSIEVHGSEVVRAPGEPMPGESARDAISDLVPV